MKSESAIEINSGYIVQQSGKKNILHYNILKE